MPVVPIKTEQNGDNEPDFKRYITEFEKHLEDMRKIDQGREKLVRFFLHARPFLQMTQHVQAEEFRFQIFFNYSAVVKVHLGELHFFPGEREIQVKYNRRHPYRADGIDIVNERAQHLTYEEIAGIWSDRAELLRCLVTVYPLLKKGLDVLAVAARQF